MAQHYGLQAHSVGGPFPFVVVGIDNPTGLEPGLYWYVQDVTGKRCTIHTRSCSLAGDWAASYVARFPGGVYTASTPNLERSEGYIVPKPATVTLPFEVVAALDAYFGGDGGDWCHQIEAFKAAFKAAYPH